MDSLTEVHDSLMRRLQLIERKVSLISIQLGQVADAVYRLSNKDSNTAYFKELNAATVAQPQGPGNPLRP